MKKDLLVIHLGYYHPNNANWNYQIYLLTTGKASVMVRTTFGGDYRIAEQLEKEGYKINRQYWGIGNFKWNDIKNLMEEDNIERIKELLQ